MSFEPVQFGKYRLQQSLAQGGMAEIFLARQQGPAGYEKVVVIKRVLGHFSSDPDFVEMFLDEARLAAQLSHPGIVQIFDFGEVDGSYYLCMEYLRGEDLHAVLKHAKKQHSHVPAQVAATLLHAACDALHYAHTLTTEDGRPLNLVHRDISPSNLFVTYQGVVKVLDFGIARAEGKVVKTATGVIKGKLAYMAPEQARNHPLDARTDVWALGCTLYELLTGQRLFWKGGQADALRAVLEDPIVPPSRLVHGVPAELDDVCLKALQRVPDQRYASARAMYEDLDDYLASRTYVPAQSLLQQYLKQLVGEEVISQRMKVPTGSIQGAPVPPPRASPNAKTASLKRAPVVMEAEPEAPAPAPAPPAPKVQPLQVLTLLTAVLVCVAAGAWLLSRPQPVEVPTLPPPARPIERPPEEEVVAAPAPEEEVAAPDAATAIAPVVEAPVVEAPVVEAPPEVAPAKSPKPARGQLDVNCVPWCRIWLDGKDSGRTSPALGISLSAGKHRLRVMNPPTGIEHEREIVIRAGATTREVVRF